MSQMESTQKNPIEENNVDELKENQVEDNTDQIESNTNHSEDKQVVENTKHLEKYARLNEIRLKQCPFLLRLFFRENSHHNILEFGEDLLPLEDEIQTHAWMNTSLGEISIMLKHMYAKEIEKDNLISFKIIYFDRNKNKFLAKDAGAVIYGRRSILDDKTLGELNFYIGDYISIAILPPQPLDPVASTTTRVERLSINRRLGSLNSSRTYQPYRNSRVGGANRDRYYGRRN